MKYTAEQRRSSLLRCVKQRADDKAQPIDYVAGACITGLGLWVAFIWISAAIVA